MKAEQDLRNCQVLEEIKDATREEYKIRQR